VPGRNGRAASHFRNPQVLRAQRRHLEVWCIFLEQIQRQTGAVQALAGHFDGQVFNMQSARIDVRSVAQAEFEIDGRGDLDDSGHFIIADEAAKVVGHFDVDIDGNIDRLAEGAHLRRAQVRGTAQRAWRWRDWRRAV